MYHYVDPQGREQGPFAYAHLAKWFKAGYLRPNLGCRRQDETTYARTVTQALLEDGELTMSDGRRVVARRAGVKGRPGAVLAPAGVRAAVRASGAVVVAAADPAVDYDAMDVDALEKEIETARRRLFDMRLEKRQQAKRATFKSSEVRELKAKVARMMPFYEAKLGGDARSGTTRAAPWRRSGPS